MQRSTGLSNRRSSGALLVGGFALLIPGVVFAVSSQTGSSYVPPSFSARAGAILLSAGLALTFLGLLGFDRVLWDAGDRVLSGMGTVAYALAVVSWLFATERGLVAHEWPYGFEVGYIVAAHLSMLAFAAAVIRTGAIPRWIGWLAAAWAAGGLILFALPREGFPPLFPQFVPLLFGVALLRTASADQLHG